MFEVDHAPNVCRSSNVSARMHSRIEATAIAVAIQGYNWIEIAIHSLSFSPLFPIVKFVDVFLFSMTKAFESK